ARLQEGQIEACLDEAPPLIVFFWGDPAPYIRDAHRQGSKVFVQVGSVAEAKAAAEAGVNGVIAQGMEAGGHVRSTTALSALLPAVVDAVTPLPVIASGGIANGRGLVAALSLGADAVSLGTRFLCSEEAFAAPEYKQRILRSTAEDTVYLSLFDIGWDAPHRVLRNLTVDEWERAGRPARGERQGAARRCDRGATQIRRQFLSDARLHRRYRERGALCWRVLHADPRYETRRPDRARSGRRGWRDHPRPPGIIAMTQYNPNPYE